MTKHRKSDVPPGEHEVGYKKPPKATQFKDGHAPLPGAGRPKKRRAADNDEISLSAALWKAVSQQVTVSVRGRSTSMSVLDYLAEKLANDAVKGNAKDIALLARLLANHAPGPKAIAITGIEMEEVLRPDYVMDYLRFYLRRRGVELTPELEAQLFPPGEESIDIDDHEVIEDAVKIIQERRRRIADEEGSFPDVRDTSWMWESGFPPRRAGFVDELEGTND